MGVRCLTCSTAALLVAVLLNSAAIAVSAATLSPSATRSRSRGPTFQVSPKPAATGTPSASTTSALRRSSQPTLSPAASTAAAMSLGPAIPISPKPPASPTASPSESAFPIIPFGPGSQGLYAGTAAQAFGVQPDRIITCSNTTLFQDSDLTIVGVVERLLFARRLDVFDANGSGLLVPAVDARFLDITSPDSVVPPGRAVVLRSTDTTGGTINSPAPGQVNSTSPTVCLWARHDVSPTGVHSLQLVELGGLQWDSLGVQCSATTYARGGLLDLTAGSNWRTQPYCLESAGGGSLQRWTRVYRYNWVKPL